VIKVGTGDCIFDCQKLQFSIAKHIYSCKVNKGIALEMISEYYNIEINEIACIGDSENDIYMFDKVKYSVAMENALPEVKNKALYITKSNDDDGVAYALKELIRKYK
jgi:hydroxymethylpyrimidine pyrophosphatase-like HAD family hydrolase